MTDTARNIYIDGLRNAHAMENQAEEIMERQAERLTDYPEVQTRVRQHLEETREQKRRLEQCLESMGERESAVKDAAMSFMGNMAAMTNAMASDEILKNMFSNDAFEHFEIASYKSLLTLCERAGMADHRAPLEMSLQEEERMGRWVEDHIPDVTLAYIGREERMHAA